MNLVDLFNRKDQILTVHPSVKQHKCRMDNVTWRGLRCFAAPTPQIVVAKAQRWYPFCTRPMMVGWLARVGDGTVGRLEVSLRHGDGVLARKEIELSSTLTPVLVPWPVSAAPVPTDASLALHFLLAEGVMGEVLVCPVLDRGDLLKLARGRGVEIGPGPRPQVLPAPDVDIIYVEETPRERWAELYDSSAKYMSSGTADAELWDRYVIGTADTLPVEDGSLDFIFSSHVFEHLSNPLGHLDLWVRKLRKGGMILAVVPDIGGCKDYTRRPSGHEEFIREFKAAIWRPTHDHYLRFAASRNGTAAEAKAMAEQNASIHVHGYTRHNMAALLEEAVQRFHLSHFHLIHADNHKDFHFVLTK